MKKTILAVVAVFALAFTSNAQSFELGINGALPLGDAGDVADFSIGIDAAAFWDIAENFDAGIAVGFTNAFTSDITILGQTVEVDDVQFLPIAATSRYSLSDDFYVGGDLGYAIGINDGNEGGFYYRPKIGYNVTEKITVNLSYTGIANDGDSFDTVGLGVAFGL